MAHAAAIARGESVDGARFRTAPAPLGRDALLAAAAAYQHMFPAAGDATALRASFEMTFLIGWAPDDTPSVQRQGR